MILLLLYNFTILFMFYDRKHVIDGFYDFIIKVNEKSRLLLVNHKHFQFG